MHNHSLYNTIIERLFITVFLNCRESEVNKRLAFQGLSNRDLAILFNNSEKTIKNHIASIIEKPERAPVGNYRPCFFVRSMYHCFQRSSKIQIMY